MQKKTYSFSHQDTLYEVEFSDLASQASGSVMVKAKNTIILATVVVAKNGDNNPGYFNLTVEYQEKFYASGEILGGQYNKREGRPSENAILSGRIIDRTIRPLFNQRIKNAIQVSVSVLALGDFDPRVLGVLGASLAIEQAGINWNGPISSVLLSKENAVSEPRLNQYILNNQRNQDAIEHYLKILVCGDGNNINMIEAEGLEAKEQDLANVFVFANENLKIFTDWQKNIIKDLGQKNTSLFILEINSDIINHKDIFLKDKENLLFNKDSKEAISSLNSEWQKYLENQLPDLKNLKEQGQVVFDEFCDEVYHKYALEKKQRPDGRELDEVRPLFSQAGGFGEKLHGTGIFYRGETHILSILTLGGPADRQTIEEIENKENRRFMHHYNFPPFSTGDVGRFEGANRRAIGHGALGEKALKPAIPNADTFPYTIRIVSEALSSNGSTSQASICAASLALMDAGVPIKNHIAGISIGAMIDYHNPSNYCLLTDIQGPEDHHGDMDFKVAGTVNGINAIQLDVKVVGVSPQLLINALEKAKIARYKIIDNMNEAINVPRSDLSIYAPRIESLKIPVDKIGMVIGGGGKTIKEIMEKSSAEITIEDDGTVYLTGKKESIKIAKDIIESMVKVWQVGDQGLGEVVKILPNIGAILKINEYADGLVHISEIATFRVVNIEDLLKIGDKVPFTIIKIEEDKNRLSLSIKRDNPDFFSNHN